MTRIPDCHPERKHFGHGKCRPCYTLEWRRARGIKPRALPHGGTLLERINARRDVRGWDECWPRIRGSKRIQFGAQRNESTELRRAVWLLEHGSFPEHYQHLEVSCGNALCLNPRHIYRQTEEQRFWVKVDKSGGPLACWLWQGSRTRKGYGQFHFHKRADGVVFAHRHAWRLTTRLELPRETFLCHHCDTPLCVNPAHLFPGTPKDNVHDMVMKGRHPTIKPHHLRKSEPSGCATTATNAGSKADR